MSVSAEGAFADRAPLDERAVSRRSRSLHALVVAEGFERFAYFGVLSILSTSLMERALHPEDMQADLWIGMLMSGLKSIGVGYSPERMVSIIFGIFGSLVYASPLLGGIVADKLLGSTITIKIGAGLSATGCLLIASDGLLSLGLLLLALGAGSFKGNVASQISGLYAPEDQRREGAFRLFFIAVSTGMIAAPLICGWIGKAYDWSYGFMVAAVGMLVGLAVYVADARDGAEPRRGRSESGRKGEVTANGRRLGGLLALTLPFSIIMAGNQQIYNAYLVWADSAADLTVGSFRIPTSWLVSLDTFCSLLMLGGFILAGRLSVRAGRRACELTRIGFGGILVGLSYLLLAAGAGTGAASGSADFGWLLGFHVLNGFGFVYVIPVGLALFSRLAPPSLRASVLGLFYAQYAAASAIAGALGGLVGEMSTVRFWILHALLITAAGAAIVVGRGAFRRAFLA